MPTDSVPLHQLQITFNTVDEDTYPSLERVIGWARRTDVTLVSLRMTLSGETCYTYIRVSARSRDAISLLYNRLQSLIGLDDFMCSFDPDL